MPGKAFYYKFQFWECITSEVIKQAVNNVLFIFLEEGEEMLCEKFIKTLIKKTVEIRLCI